MAKSTRSKTKRSFRRAKREEIEKSAYAVAHAARLERLNRKLAAIAQAPGLPTSLSDTTPKPSSGEEDARHEDSDDQGDLHASQAAAAGPLGDSESMDLDTTDVKKISTHGRRLSRNQEWRAAKGLPLRKKSGKLNQKGELVAVKRAGRSKRRR